MAMNIENAAMRNENPMTATKNFTKNSTTRPITASISAATDAAFFAAGVLAVS